MSEEHRQASEKQCIDFCTHAKHASDLNTHTHTRQDACGSSRSHRLSPFSNKMQELKEVRMCVYRLTVGLMLEECAVFQRSESDALCCLGRPVLLQGLRSNIIFHCLLRWHLLLRLNRTEPRDWFGTTYNLFSAHISYASSVTLCVIIFFF